MTALRAEGCGRLSAAGCVRFAQGATAPTALKVAVSPSRAMSFISRLRRSRQHRVSILPAYLVHPFPLRGTSPQGETRALRDLLSVSYGKITILLTGSLRSPPPIRLRRTFHLKVKRLTMICASLALLHPLLSLTHWIFRSLCIASLRGPPIGGQDCDGASYRCSAPYTLSRFAELPLKGKRENRWHWILCHI